MKKKIILYSILCLGAIMGCSKGLEVPEKMDKSANLRAVGVSANDILANTNFDKLWIEIAYVKGFRPSTTSISNFVNYLKARTFKEDIKITYKELISPGKDTLELEEIHELEMENRTAYNNGRTLAIYIYFADAPSDDDKEEGLVTLGAVYRNTSMVIYEATIKNLASKSNSIKVTDVETATLQHEFGHLFGLVDLGTDPVNDHEDDEVENHCDVDGCLMKSEIQFGGSMMKTLKSNAFKGLAAVPTLDAECILDLQSNGGR